MPDGFPPPAFPAGWRRWVGRLGGAAVVVWAVVTAAFAAVQTLPGGPVRALVGPRATPAQVRAVARALGLARPWWAQYGAWWGHALRGDFGWSYATGQPVVSVLADAAPRTLTLAGLALALGFAAGFGLATIQAARAGTRADRWCAAALGAAYAAPPYWVGLGLLGWLAEDWRWLPAGGDQPGAVWLPAITLAIPVAATVARYVRPGLAAVRGAPWWRAARTRGVPPARLWLAHGLRHAAAPAILALGWIVPPLIAGSVVVEAVFNYPGLGWTLWQAAQARDLPVILGGAMLVAGVTTGVGLLVDLVAGTVDRRLRRTS